LTVALKKAEAKKPLTLKEHKGISRLVKALGGMAIISCVSCGFNAKFCQGAGCKADADLATGIIAETRIPEGKKSNYYQLREIEANRPTFLQGLFKGGN
jgi:hypothetical protein